MIEKEGIFEYVKFFFDVGAYVKKLFTEIRVRGDPLKW